MYSCSSWVKRIIRYIIQQYNNIMKCCNIFITVTCNILVKELIDENENWFSIFILESYVIFNLCFENLHNRIYVISLSSEASLIHIYFFFPTKHLTFYVFFFFFNWGMWYSKIRTKPPLSLTPIQYTGFREQTVSPHYLENESPLYFKNSLRMKVTFFFFFWTCMKLYGVYKLPFDYFLHD